MKIIKKPIFLFISIVIIIIVVVLKFYLLNYLSSFYQIDEWGIYLFAVPMGYCFFRTITNQLSFKIFISIFCGVLISILLSRTGNFMLQKILTTVVGAVIIWALDKLTKSNKIS